MSPQFSRALRILSVVVGCALAYCPIANADVTVTVTGSVEFNQINSPPLNAAAPGAPALLTFSVDETVFVDSVVTPSRGYPIDPASFALTMGAVTVGLQSPIPPGEIAYFILRNNFPAADSFVVASNIDGINGVPLMATGMFGMFRNNFYVTYGGATLSSLDILDALGTYDFTGLSVFNWTIDDGPFNAAGLIFETLTIETPTLDLFQRGDCNDDAMVNIADAIALLAFLFPMPGSPVVPLDCEDPCDGNDDGDVNLADAITILSALFMVPAVPLPPPTGACGSDSTGDMLICPVQPAC